MYWWFISLGVYKQHHLRIIARAQPIAEFLRHSTAGRPTKLTVKLLEKPSCKEAVVGILANYHWCYVDWRSRDAAASCM